MGEVIEEAADGPWDPEPESWYGWVLWWLTGLWPPWRRQRHRRAYAQGVSDGIEGCLKRLANLSRQRRRQAIRRVQKQIDDGSDG